MPLTQLDSQYYPHILDTVMAHASHPVLRAFRGTTSAIRSLVDARLFSHLVLKDGSPCLLDALTPYTSTPLEPTATAASSPSATPKSDFKFFPLTTPSSSSTSGASTDSSHLDDGTYLIIQPLGPNGVPVVPPDAELAPIRTLDIQAPVGSCQCERCEGILSWGSTLDQARFRSLIALRNPPWAITSSLRLLRIFGDFGGGWDMTVPNAIKAEFAETLGEFGPLCCVVHFCNALYYDSDDPARRLIVPTRTNVHQRGGWSDVVLNYRYSSEDEGFPFLDFYSATYDPGEGGKTYFILFTPEPVCHRWIYSHRSREIGNARVLNHLALHVAAILRAVPDRGGEGDLVTLVGPEWDPEWISDTWGETKEELRPSTDLESRFRWWVRALSWEDAARVESGIAYCTHKAFKAYIGNDVEYGLIMAP